MRLAHNSMLLAAGLALGLAGAAQAAAPAGFMITSTTFKDGTMLPVKVAGKNPPDAARPNPNCVGENVSPQLSWANPPDGTKSYAFTVVDEEGRGGLEVFHWVAYGIPTTVTSFAEGEVAQPSDKFVGGKSSQGVGTFSGPCTPPGSPHHYVFKVYATDFDVKDLAPGLTLPEFLDKLNGHQKSAASIIGLFVKP